MFNDDPGGPSGPRDINDEDEIRDIEGPIGPVPTYPGVCVQCTADSHCDTLYGTPQTGIYYSCNLQNTCQSHTAVCPANASGAPSCECDPGYSGSLTWNAASHSWSGSCIGECEDDSDCDAGQVGYEGYCASGSCQTRIVNCPSDSEPVILANGDLGCECSFPNTGEVNWITWSESWRSVCCDDSVWNDCIREIE